MRGLGESLFHRRRIAFLPCQADIVGRLLVKTRRTGRQCRSEVDDWVERRVADIDALDCVERSLRIFGDDHRYSLADVSHPPGGKGRTGREAHRRTAFRLRPHGTGQGAEPPAETEEHTSEI